MLVEDIIESFGATRERLLDIALAVQTQFGHIGDDAIQRIATGLGLHPVEVAETISFYAFFDHDKRGHHRIRLSKTPISMIKGAAGVAEAFEQALGVTMGGTTADGGFTIEWTADIGMADQEPAALVNGMARIGLTPGDVPDLIAALRRGQVASNVRSSLVKAGPLLTGPLIRGDAIKAALALSPDAVIAEIIAAKLRGRGGAGFPTGLKWRLTRKAEGRAHTILCNADEGEPGTFKDRMLLDEFPDLVFDGMTIAGYALGSHEGILYLRGEYAWLLVALQENLARRHADGLLGDKILGQAGFDFDIRIQLGAGAYICGEESSLIESLEGKRGSPRDRPPFPTEHGYLQQPTAIDNVETLVCAARIMENGSAWFKGFGTAASTGTKLMSIAGDCARPGVYEVPFGITVYELLDLCGATDAAYVQVSGPSGQAVAPKDFGRCIAYEDLSTGGSTMIFGPKRDVLDIVHQFSEFFAGESCGWCAPCRVGTTLLKQGMAKMIAGRATLSDLAAMERLAHSVVRMSRCGLGQTAPLPILTTMLNFPGLYEARLASAAFEPRVTLNDALREAVSVQGREPVPMGA
jgi:[NiFe] hydrogenase diaphorase moiety large subunit